MSLAAGQPPTAAEIAALVQAFEDCTLPYAQWTHTAHLLMALGHLHRLPRPEATVAIRTGIQRYNASLGRGPGYHETITLAWIAVIARFLAEHDRGQPLAELAAALLERCGAKDYLLRYWTRAVLFSAEARQRWVPPDLQVIEG